MLQLMPFFEIGQRVYLKTDVNQLPYLVISYNWDGRWLMYELQQGASTLSKHFDYEIASEIDTVLKTSY